MTLADTLTMILQPPLLDGGGHLPPSTTLLDEDALVATGADHDDVVVSLAEISSATEAEVKALTAFLWRLRTEGAEPRLEITHHDVWDACAALKLDRAFTVTRP